MIGGTNPWLLLVTAVVVAGAIYWHANRWLERQPPRNVVDDLWDDFYGDEVEL